ncbi:hypothetical protein F4776DRAFT_70290 [Hypoxylon sp. NC0597]|nr:hypothetical protein F4776DRAFT_70290 [Hypoxylon sp. NC0597]
MRSRLVVEPFLAWLFYFGIPFCIPSRNTLVYDKTSPGSDSIRKPEKGSPPVHMPPFIHWSSRCVPGQSTTIRSVKVSIRSSSYFILPVRERCIWVRVLGNVTVLASKMLLSLYNCEVIWPITACSFVTSSELISPISTPIL